MREALAEKAGLGRPGLAGKEHRTMRMGEKPRSGIEADGKRWVGNLRLGASR